MAFPLGFQGRHVDDDAAAGLGAFAQTDSQHTAWNAEILDRAGQGEGVGWNDADVPHEIHERFLVEGLGVNDGRIDIRENLELVGAAHIITVAARAIAHDALTIDGANLSRLERFNHAVGGRAPDPAITLDGHGLTQPLKMARILAPQATRNDVSSVFGDFFRAKTNGTPARGR